MKGEGAYLRLLTIPDICRRHQKRCLWREKKICQAEKFLHMTDCHVEKFLNKKCQVDKFSTYQSVSWRNVSPQGKYGEMWRQICPVEEFLRMRNEETTNLFGHNSCYFVAKSVLLPFRVFCPTNNCVCGEKGQISGMQQI